MKLVHYGPEGGKSTLEIPNPGSERKVAKIWFFGFPAPGDFGKDLLENFVREGFCGTPFAPKQNSRRHISYL